jgi:glycosyltransferase involved in cell wall biosynthesis
VLEDTTVRREAPATIVIPALNAASTLDTQLRAIAEQDCAGPVDVIVVDNRSTDTTAAIAKAWGDRIPGLRVLDAPDRTSPGYARNVGINMARGELILMCDADDVVDRSWAARLAEALEVSDAVAGGAISWDGGPLPNTARPNAFKTGLGFLPGFSTCSAAIRKPVWEAVGGFDENLAEGEDLDLAWRLQLAGFTLSDHPEAFVFYREPTGVAGALRKWYRYGRCQVRLYVKHRDAGLPADPPWKAVAKWLLLLATSYRLLRNTPARRVWCRDAGRRAGRLAGSLHDRVLFL